MSLLTYGCPDPTNGRTEEPTSHEINVDVWVSEDKKVPAEFKFTMFNGLIQNVEVHLKNIYTQSFDAKVNYSNQFDQEFKEGLRFYGIQFEEINY